MKWRRVSDDPPAIGTLVAAVREGDVSQLGFVFRVTTDLLTSMKEGELWCPVPQLHDIAPPPEPPIGERFPLGSWWVYAGESDLNADWWRVIGYKSDDEHPLHMESRYGGRDWFRIVTGDTGRPLWKPAQLAGGWQSMDTAPSEATRILSWLKGGRVQVCGGRGDPAHETQRLAWKPIGPGPFDEVES